MRALVSAASAAGVPLSGPVRQGQRRAGQARAVDHDVRLAAQPLGRHEGRLARDAGQRSGVGGVPGRHRRPQDSAAAILRPVDFLADNGVPISAIIFGVLVLAALVVLGIAGLRLWRVIKGVQREVTGATGALTAEVAQLQESLDRQPRAPGRAAGGHRRAVAARRAAPGARGPRLRCGGHPALAPALRGEVTPQRLGVVDVGSNSVQPPPV